MDDSKENNNKQSKILVVEDSMIASKAVANMLTHMHCMVDIASEGQTALMLAKKNSYDLIFMDIGLPDFDGYELTKKIRTSESTVPIVALTAHIDEATKINCINIGMNAVVTKPLGSEQAKEILDTLIPHRNPVSSINNDITPAKREAYAALPLFDFGMALKHFGDEKLAKEMVTAFASSLPGVKLALKSAYENKDWDTIKKIMLKLQGETSYCGLKRLNQACIDMENTIKANNINTYDSLYRWVFQIINATQQTLEENALV